MLDVRSEYLTASYLASSRIEISDPSRACFYGQQLIVRYHLLAHCFTPDTEMKVTLRFGSRDCETFCIPLESSRGYWTYRLMGERYGELGGLISYKVELFSEGTLIETAKHHLWVDLIELG